MPAPPADLTTGLRAGTYARHLLFYLDHDEGAIRAWTGRGDLLFEGNTYVGVHGLAEIGGVSNSNDLQNHELRLRLNSVPLSALQVTDHNVRNRTVRLTAVWFTAAGGLHTRSLVLFEGRGDYLISHVSGDAADLELIARGPMADWARPPLAYYTDAWQRRNYPSDDGLTAIVDMESASTQGWGPNAEAVPSVTIAWDSRFKVFRTSDTDTLIVDSTNGAGVTARGGKVVWSPDEFGYLEQGSGAPAKLKGGIMRVGSSPCRLADDSFVQSSAAARIIYQTASGRRLKKMSVISSLGSNSGDDPEISTFISTTSPRYRYITRNKVSVNGTNNFKHIIIDNNDGNVVAWDEHEDRVINLIRRDRYREEDTNSEITLSGTKLQVGGSDCYIATSDAILSPSGKKLVRIGGDAAVHFLRVAV